MGIFGKVILGGLAFLAGAAFMADENEKQRKQPWKRLPNNQLNADKAPITPSIKEWLDKNADLDEETKMALCNDLTTVMEEWNRNKAAGSQTPPTCNDSSAPQQSANPSIIPQQPLVKFPIYGTEHQKGQWSPGAQFEQARQIGVLEVYRDSIRDLVNMPEFKDFKLDKEVIKKFLDNEFVQAFLKSRIAKAGISMDWFHPTAQAESSTQSAATANPAPAPESTSQTVQSSDNVANAATSNANTAEHRNSSVISVTSGKIGCVDLTDSLKKK